MVPRIPWLLLMAVFMFCPNAFAETSGDLDPNVIRKEIEGLRAIYTDEHPDVILLQRKLEKAEGLECQQELRRKALPGRSEPRPINHGDVGLPSAAQPAGTDTTR